MSLAVLPAGGGDSWVVLHFRRRFGNGEGLFRVFFLWKEEADESVN